MWPRATKRGGDGLQQRQHRGAVRQDGMRSGCQLGGPGTFQQYRMGETLHSRDVRSGRCGHLFDGRAGANSRLDLLWD